MTIETILQPGPVGFLGLGAMGNRGVMPFIASDILRLIILVLFPWISLVIPNSMN